MVGSRLFERSVQQYYKILVSPIFIDGPCRGKCLEHYSLLCIQFLKVCNNQKLGGAFLSCRNLRSRQLSLGQLANFWTTTQEITINYHAFISNCQKWFHNSNKMHVNRLLERNVYIMILFLSFKETVIYDLFWFICGILRHHIVMHSL